MVFEDEIPNLKLTDMQWRGGRAATPFLFTIVWYWDGFFNAKSVVLI